MAVVANACLQNMMQFCGQLVARSGRHGVNVLAIKENYLNRDWRYVEKRWFLQLKS